jgi:hypothetical protein
MWSKTRGGDHGRHHGISPEVTRKFLRSEVLTAVVSRTIIFSDIMPCRLFKVNLRFGGTLSLSSGSRNKPRKKTRVKAGCKPSYFRPVNMFFRNVC